MGGIGVKIVFFQPKCPGGWLSDDMYTTRTSLARSSALQMSASVSMILNSATPTDYGHQQRNSGNACTRRSKIAATPEAVLEAVCSHENNFVLKFPGHELSLLYLKRDFIFS